MPTYDGQISQVKLPNGNLYEVKDAYARDQIATLSGYTKYLGVTTTDVKTNPSTNPVTIAGAQVTATVGDIVNYGSGEFIWNGAETNPQWQEFGDLSGLGDMAYADTASGTVSGSVSFTNTDQTATVSPAASGDATYEPAGNITTPTISIKTAGGTTTVKNPTAVTVAKTVTAVAPGSTAPSNPVTWCAMGTGTGNTECLNLYQIGYTTGDSITTENVTVKTSDGEYESSQPTFSGTGVRLVTSAISVPTSGSISAPVTVNPDTTP